MDNREPLTIFSIPVSGGNFINQCASAILVYEAKKSLCKGRFPSYKAYRPDICFGSSGGNVAAYICLASDWSTDNIMRTLSHISPDMFVKSWFPQHMNFIPTGVLGIFNGSLYKQGYGATCTFNRYFNNKNFQDVEIWTGTYNITENKSEFFCNRSKENAYIQQSFFENDMETYSALPLRYMSDEPQTLNLAAKASIASASIPYIVEPQKIGDCMYSDGGITYSSPTMPFSNEICRLVNGHVYPKEIVMDRKGNVSYEQKILSPRKLRHFYFSPYDMYSKEIVVGSRTINGAISQVLYSNLLQDKASAIENLQKLYGIESNQLTHEHYIDVDENTLSDILVKLDKYDHYVCDLYPKGLVKVSLNHFTYEEIKQKIEYVRDNNYSIQIWYYEN